jgi:hypothetical protein
MERRDVLKYTALLMGASLSTGTIAALVAGCKVDNSIDWEPAFLTHDQVSFMDELAETILPKTKTPGAKDALVTRFIDTIRPLRFSNEDNEEFKTNLDAFIQNATQELGKDFVKVSAEKRLEWVTGVDKASYEMIKNKDDEHDLERPFYLSLKEQILGGYFSSEIVAKEYFEFDPVPGRYDGCIPYEDIGRAWAL